jgi:hypothetical protein
MPINLISKTLVMLSVDKTKKPVLMMNSIPLGLVIPSYSDVTFKLKLDDNSEFNVGDILETTLSYSVPTSNDVYLLVHRFKKSTNTSNGQVQNALGNNQDKVDSYKKEKTKK